MFCNHHQMYFSPNTLTCVMYVYEVFSGLFVSLHLQLQWNLSKQTGYLWSVYTSGLFMQVRDFGISFQLINYISCTVR